MLPRTIIGAGFDAPTATSYVFKDAKGAPWSIQWLSDQFKWIAATSSYNAVMLEGQTEAELLGKIDAFVKSMPSTSYTSYLSQVSPLGGGSYVQPMSAASPQIYPTDVALTPTESPPEPAKSSTVDTWPQPTESGLTNKPEDKHGESNTLFIVGGLALMGVLLLAGRK